jgi:hypothetical protein
VGKAHASHSFASKPVPAPLPTLQVFRAAAIY